MLQWKRNGPELNYVILSVLQFGRHRGVVISTVAWVRTFLYGDAKVVRPGSPASFHSTKTHKVGELEALNCPLMYV